MGKLKTLSKNIKLLKLAILFVILCAGGKVWGDDYYWRDVASGDWSNPDNWSSTQDGTAGTTYPGQNRNNDKVYIRRSNPTINLDKDITVDTLFLDSDSAHNMNVALNLTGSHTLTMTTFDMPSKGTYSFTISSETTVIITTNIFGDMTGGGTPDPSMTFYGTGTLYIPASGTNVNYGNGTNSNCISYASSLQLKPYGEPDIYTATISNIDNFPTQAISIALKGSPKIPYKLRVNDFQGTVEFSISGSSSKIDSTKKQSIELSVPSVTISKDTGTLTTGDGFSIDILSPDGYMTLASFTWYMGVPSWIGKTSDWFDTNNWSNAPADLSDFSSVDVVINKTTHNPVISGAVTVQSLSIGSGASVSVDTGGTLNSTNGTTISGLGKLEITGGTVNSNITLSTGNSVSITDGTLNTKTLNIGSGSTFNATGGTVNITSGGSGLTVNSSSTTDFNSLTIGSGASADFSSKEISFSGNLTINGTLSNPGKLVFSKNSDQTFTPQAGEPTFNIGITKTGGKLTIANPVKINNFTSGTGTYTVELDANTTFQNDPAFKTGQNVTVTANGILVCEAPATFGGSVTNNGTISGSQPYTFNGDFTNDGTVSATGDFTFKGNCTHNTANWTPANLIFSGTAAQTFTPFPSKTYTNITNSNTSQAGLTINNALYITTFQNKGIASTANLIVPAIIDNYSTFNLLTGATCNVTNYTAQTGSKLNIDAATISSQNAAELELKNVSFTGDATLNGGNGLKITNATYNSKNLTANGKIALASPQGTDKIGTLTVNGTLTTFESISAISNITSNGTIDSSHTINVTGSITNNGTISGTGTFNIAGNFTNSTGHSVTASKVDVKGSFTDNGNCTALDKITFSGTTEQNFTPVSTTEYNLELSAGSNVNVITNPLTVKDFQADSSASLKLSGGGFTSTSANNITIPALVIPANTDTSLSTSSKSLSITNAPYNGNNITITSGEVTLPAGTLGNLSINSSATVTAGGNITASDITISGSLTTSSDITARDISVNGTFTSGSNLTAKNITLNAGSTFDAGSAAAGSAITLSGNWSKDSTANFNHHSGSITFSANTTVSGDNTFNDVIFDGQATLTDNNTFSNATFNNTATLNGDNTFANATFKGDTTFDGTNTFTNFTCTTPGKTITFPTGKTQTISNNFTVTGTDNGANVITMKSSTDGFQWSIDVQNDYSIENAAIKDGNNISTRSAVPLYLKAKYSVDNGNNSFWTFIGTVYTWQGNSSNWNTATNWSPASIPGPGAGIEIANTSNNPVLPGNINIYSTDGSDSYGNITIKSGATLDIGSNEIEINSLTNQGLLKVAENGKIVAHNKITNSAAVEIHSKDAAQISDTVENAQTSSVTYLSGSSVFNFGTAYGNLTLNSGSSLSTSQDITINADFTNNGTLTTSHSFTIAGNAVNGGTINGTGKFDIDGNFKNELSKSVTASEIQVRGDFTDQGDCSALAQINFNGTAAEQIFTPKSTTVYNSITNSSENGLKLGAELKTLSFINNKAFNLNTFALTVNSMLTNNGSIIIGANTLQTENFTGANDSVLSVSGGKLVSSSTSQIIIPILDVTNSADIAGKITINALNSTDSSIVLSSGFINLPSASLKNLTIENGTEAELSGNLTLTDLTNKGILNTAKTLSIAGNAVNGGTVSGTGKFDIDGNFTNELSKSVTASEIQVRGDFTDQGDCSAVTSILFTNGTLAQNFTPNAGITYNSVTNSAAGGLTLKADLHSDRFENNSDFTLENSDIYINSLTNASSLNIGSNILTLASYTANGNNAKLSIDAGSIVSVCSDSSGLSLPNVHITSKGILDGGTNGINLTDTVYTSAPEIVTSGKITLSSGGTIGTLTVNSSSELSTSEDFITDDIIVSGKMSFTGNFAAKDISVETDGHLSSGAEMSAVNFEIKSNGTFDAGSEAAGSAITLSGNWTKASTATFNHKSSSITFTADTTVTGDNIFNDVIFDGQATLNGDNTFSNATFNSTATLTDDNTFATATFNASATLSGDNTFTAATFKGDTTFSGTNTFTNFTCTTPGKTITFPAGKTQTIENLTINGTSEAARISMISSTSGTNWLIKITGINSVDFADIKDCKNSSESFLTASHSIDSGNNVNWNFTGMPYSWTGSEDSLWHNAANWTPASIPGSGTIVSITDTSVSVPELDKNATIGSEGTLTIGSEAQFKFLDKSFTAGKITNNGSIEIQGSRNQISAEVHNGTDSKVTYTTGTSFFSWGSDYENLIISGTAATSTDFNVAKKFTLQSSLTMEENDINVSGDSYITGTLKAKTAEVNNVVLNGKMDLTTLTLSGKVTLANDSTIKAVNSLSFTGSTIDASNFALNLYSNNEISLLDNFTAKSLVIENASKINFSGTIDITGIENLTLSFPVHIADNTTIKSNASVIFQSNGKLTSSSEKLPTLTISASEDIILFNVDLNQLTLSAKKLFVNDDITTNETLIFDLPVSCSNNISIASTGITFTQNAPVELNSSNLNIEGNLLFNSSVSRTESTNKLSVNGNLILNSTFDIFIKSPVEVTKNFVLYSGNLNLNSNLSVGKDIILLGPNYNSKDLQTGMEDIYKYQNHQIYNYNESELPDTTDIPVTYNGTISTANGITVTGKENLYLNGLTATSTGEWNLKLKSNYNTDTNFAVAYNCDFSASNCNISSLSENTTVSIATEKTKVMKDKENGWNLEDFHITEASTIDDDIIEITFDRPVKNLSSYLNNNIRWITNSEGTYTGIYQDAQCSIPLASDAENFATVYIKSANSWNTDATGLTSGTENSTDKNGQHKNTVPYLDIKRNTTDYNYFVTDLYGKRLIHYSDNTASGTKKYTQIADHCSPVLVSARTGQENHQMYDASIGESSQHSYDAHNFIEFRYSEPVNFGSEDSAISDLWIPAFTDTKALNSVENIQVTNKLGALNGNITQEGELKFAGLVNIANGKIHTGSKNQTDKYVNALYRQDEYSIKISIAGYTDGTFTDRFGNSVKNWKGYIENAVLPSGEVQIDGDSNPLVSDMDKNIQTKAKKTILMDSLEDGIYGKWDLTEPSFAPFRKKASIRWDDSQNSELFNNYEVIGNRTSAGDTIDRIEFHLFDNKPAYNTSDKTAWLTERGWCENTNAENPDLYKDYSYCADIFGGSRPFADDVNVRTSGGIRYSSAYYIRDAFSFTNVQSGDTVTFSDIFYIGSSATLFTGSSNVFRNADFPDSLYFGLGINESDISINNSFSIKYDETKGCLTDLAGNRLRTTEIKTIDRTPPSFNIAFSPINQDEIYISLVKSIIKNTENLNIIDNETGKTIPISENFITLLPKCFEIVKIDETGAYTPSESLKIDYSSPAKFDSQKSTTEFTGFILKLSRAVTLEDIKTLHIRVTYPKITGYPDDYFKLSKDPVTGIKNSMVTLIQDENNNFIPMFTAHALSDFAIHGVKPLHAYQTDMTYESDFIMPHLYDNTSFAVHDWSAEQQNYGTLPANKPISVVTVWNENTGDDSVLFKNLRMYLANKPDSNSVSKKYNSDFNTNLRTWLPKIPEFSYSVPALSTTTNENYKIQDSEPNGKTKKDGHIFNIPLETVSNWNSGDTVSFLFGMMNDDNSPVSIYNNLFYDSLTDSYNLSKSNKIPLFSLRLSNPSDITSLDLWSFKLRSVTEQRGGATILNNVINITNGEKAVLKVNLPQKGKLDVIVTTSDGNIVQYLNHGITESGEHYYSWNGKNKNGNLVARGIYFVRIIGPGIDETRKIMCVK